MVPPLVATVLIIAGITAIMNIHEDHFRAMAYPQYYGKGDYAFGPISSIQYDENNKPLWIAVGNWKSNLLSNQSLAADQLEGNERQPLTADSRFSAQFEMVRVDGGALLTHTITDFMLTSLSETNNSTKVFNGTSTASMKEGPVTNIPTSIRDRVMSLRLDSSIIDDLFGNTPIYGIIMEDGTPHYS